MGSRTGARSVNRLMLNGSVEIGSRKVFVDLAALNHLVQSVSPGAPHLHVVIEELAKVPAWAGSNNEILAGQLKFLDPDSWLDGAIIVNLRTRQLLVFLNGSDGVALNETLKLRPCAAPKNGRKSPAFYASNEADTDAPVVADAEAKARAASLLEAIRRV